MARLKYVLGVLLILCSAIAFAEDDYDAWSCHEGDMLKPMGLQCISCGIQSYYGSKSNAKDIVPSEKWLVLLASGARAFYDINPKQKNRFSDTEKTAIQKIVISQIQAYGFCTQYISKEALRATGGARYRDLSSPEWAFFKEFIKTDQSEAGLTEAAKKFGFQHDGFFSGSNNSAFSNLKYLLDDSQIRSSFADKRGEFKSKLEEALKPEYNASGEKSSGRQILADKDKDGGLRKCLEDVRMRLNTEAISGGSSELCESMAKACSLQSTFCQSQNGSRKESVETSGGERKPLPPPPAPPAPANNGVIK